MDAHNKWRQSTDAQRHRSKLWSSLMVMLSIHSAQGRGLAGPLWLFWVPTASLMLAVTQMLNAIFALHLFS